MEEGTGVFVNILRNWLTFIVLVGVLAYAVAPLFTQLFAMDAAIEANIFINLGILVFGFIIVATIFNPGTPEPTEVTYDRPAQGGFVP